MKTLKEFISEDLAYKDEVAKSAMSTLKSLFINGFNIKASVHAAAQAYERAKNMTAERWKEFFSKVTDKIKSAKLGDGDYLFYSKIAKQGSVLNVKNSSNQINLITTLPKGKSIPLAGTEKLIIESIEVTVIEID